MKRIRITVRLIRRGAFCCKRNEKISKLFKIKYQECNTFEEAQDDIAQCIMSLKEPLLSRIGTGIPSYVVEDDVLCGDVHIEYKYKGHYITTAVAATDLLYTHGSITKNTVTLFYVDSLIKFIMAIDRHELAEYMANQKICPLLFNEEEVAHVINGCKDEELIKRVKLVFPRYYGSTMTQLGHFGK